MNLERIKLLEKYIQEDPKDPFTRYALALELAHEEQERSITLFLSLIKDMPQYVPPYYQAVIILTEQNRIEEAKIVVEQGIKMARMQNDHKAAAELKQLQAELD